MGVNKDKFIYDETDLANSDQIGAHVVGSSGSKVTSTAISGGKEALDVSINGLDWDEIVTTFPDVVTELYTYKKNSVPVQTVTVTYETSTKKVIVSLVKVRL